MPLGFGLITPIVSLLPGTPPWEVDAGPDQLRAIATAADDLGFRYLTCSEHVGVPTEVAKLRGPRFYDPLATLSFIGAVTRRVHLLTHIVVLPYHHPLALAKSYGTLDRLANGRLMFGVGVGTLKEEFELLGVDFDGRGERYEEALAALRAAFGQRQPQFEGKYFRFSDFIIDPHALRTHVPIWLGGKTPRSLRRAIALGDGWAPFGLSLDALTALLDRMRASEEYQNRTRPFDVALPLECPDDVSDHLSAFIDSVKKIYQAGATVASLTVRARSAEHYVEQLHLLKEKVFPHFAS